VGDSTGTVRLTMWDNTGESVEAADILRMSGAYAVAPASLAGRMSTLTACGCRTRRMHAPRWTSLHRGTLTVYVGKMCTIKRIGRFTMAVNERVNLSAVPWAQLDPDGSVRRRTASEHGRA